MTLLPWSEPNNDGDGSNGNLTFDIAIYPAALLVKYVTLSLNYLQGQTAVNWNTINEYNVLLFEVERSVDNKKFEKVASKLSTAVSNGNAAYNITDVTGANFAPIVYYRIRIVDKDGRISYSNTASLRLSDANNKVIVWPNPFVEEIKINHTATEASRLLVKIADNTGEIVKTESFYTIPGLNQFSINNLKKFAGGLYTVSVYTSSGKQEGKVFRIIK